MAKELLKGNIAFAEAAIRAGLQAYFGYPITPQTEALEWMSRRMPELGRAFVQAESELAAINMVYGAACTGSRVMTSSSSPGVSLMMEGISYIAGSQVPVVLVDVMRGGPGLGNIAPSQADYNQVVHGGGHGDYFPIVLSPASIQEAIDQTVLAFDLAEKYRSIVIVLIDGCLGQMMEPAELPPMRKINNDKPDWAVFGAKDRATRMIHSLNMNPPDEEVVNIHLMKQWQIIRKDEVRYREYYLNNAKFAVIGFGTAGRISLSAIRHVREDDCPVGLLRPISLNPLPEKEIDELCDQVEGILVVEMNGGQMLDDILRINRGRVSVEFYGRPGGIVPVPDEIVPEIHHMINQSGDIKQHPRDSWLERLTEKLELQNGS